MPTTPMPLETEFDDRMRWMLREAFRLHGIVHGRFSEMIEQYGAVGAAKRLMGPEFFDFDNFYPHEPRLWVETYVAEAHFAQLFTAEEISTARDRLQVLRAMNLG